ncbi:hypothetical protein QR680_015585 [Steinernema hermaphroditum]|uniref:Uncharacterized protein n=1 Tax=Steinernema hermaphroditum TaxID=289476 RepID=A0AA39HA74_9BILA|nr:hypothetical protein QR680_015585 [Steinernema hermaphroditum]
MAAIGVINIGIELYYLFLIVYKSTPGMAVYRLFLGSASICALLNSLNIAIISPQFIMRNDTLCFHSGNLSLQLGDAMLNLNLFFGNGQIQLHLAMIVYASLKLRYPTRPSLVGANMGYLIVLLFTVIPSSLFLTVRLISSDSVNCIGATSSGNMLLEVVTAELSTIVILSHITLSFQVLIYRQKSLLTIWKQSPALSLFHGSATVLAFQNIAMAAEWLLFTWGAIANVRENTFLLLIVAHVGLISRQFHNWATVGLFAQRVHCLLFPTKPVKQFNYVTLAVLFIFFSVACFGSTYVIFSNSIPEGKPVPPGCFSFNCMTANGTASRTWSSLTAVCITVVITVLGTYTLYLLHRYRQRTQTNLDKMRNNFVLYVFYIRFVCETVPFFSDFILSNAFKISLGQYIGPYGALGTTIDLNVKTLVFYVLTKRDNKVFKKTSTRTRNTQV